VILHAWQRPAVVIYCHSSTTVLSTLLFGLQDRNMTNGEYALFTFSSIAPTTFATPWINYGLNGSELDRRKQASYAVKQARKTLSKILYVNVELSTNRTINE
jgi:hypothetical protein